MGNGARECRWRHAPEARGGYWGFWKSQLSWELDTERVGSTFGARRGLTNLRTMGAARDGGQMINQNRKNVYLSPYVEKPLNSKVIKGFVPELRSRQVFFVFWDSYVLCIYVMNILCTFRISVSWVWYTDPKKNLAILIDWLILTACQPIKGYFILSDYIKKCKYNHAMCAIP